MKNRILCLICCLLVSAPLSARTIPEDKRVLIDELLEMTGAKRASNLMANKLTQELVQMLAAKNGSVDRAVVAIINKEAQTIMYEEFILNNKLYDVMYDLYDEYFTLDDMREILKFYRSSTGQRALRFLPAIQQRSMQIVREYAVSLSPKIQSRIQGRLKEVKTALDEAEAQSEGKQSEN